MEEDETASEESLLAAADCSLDEENPALDNTTSLDDAKLKWAAELEGFGLLEPVDELFEPPQAISALLNSNTPRNLLFMGLSLMVFIHSLSHQRTNLPVDQGKFMGEHTEVSTN